MALAGGGFVVHYQLFPFRFISDGVTTVRTPHDLTERGKAI